MRIARSASHGLEPDMQVSMFFWSSYTAGLIPQFGLVGCTVVERSVLACLRNIGIMGNILIDDVYTHWFHATKLVAAIISFKWEQKSRQVLWKTVKQKVESESESIF